MPGIKWIKSILDTTRQLTSRLSRLSRRETTNVESPIEGNCGSDNGGAIRQDSGPRTIGESEFVDLGIPYLAGPEFRGRFREEVILSGKGISITSLKEFLQTRKGPRELADIFGTRSRQLRAREAITRMENSLANWRMGNKFDPRVTWIVPKTAQLDSKTLSIVLIRETLMDCEGNRTDWDEILAEVDSWLPWLSLEIVNRVRMMKTSDLSLMNRVSLKMARDIRITSEVFPWSLEFPTALAELPIHVLYQFEPTSRTMTTLNDLQAVYCQNVGHLAAFNPAAWRAIHELEPITWIKLARALSSK